MRHSEVEWLCGEFVSWLVLVLEHSPTETWGFLLWVQKDPH